jgi:hypothetical protein
MEATIRLFAKAYREREIPIPTKLVTLLRLHKPKHENGSDLVFHTASGLPDTHMLKWKPDHDVKESYTVSDTKAPSNYHRSHFFEALFENRAM